MATWRSQGASACSTLPGVSGQYHQPVSAKAQTRSPKSEGRKKAETRKPKCPSVASVFGIRPSFGFRPSEFGFGRLATGGTVQYASSGGGLKEGIRPPPLGAAPIKYLKYSLIRGAAPPILRALFESKLTDLCDVQKASEPR